MGYVYALLWFVIAVVLFVQFRKESRIIIGVSAYFVFLGIWWLANQIVSVDLMGGIYVWILRGVSALVLVVCMAGYVFQRNKEGDSSRDRKKDK